VIVITGAGGFVGSHLADSFLSRGEPVLGLDLPKKVPSNLANAAQRPGFSYRACDVTRPDSVRRSLPSAPEAVFHAAASVGVGAYVGDPMQTIESIVLGTRNLLRTCLGSSTRFVFFSTSEVYGRNPAVPWTEEADRVLGPPSIDRWSYSSSKGLAEHLVNAARTQHGLATTIVRPFNIYGPRQRPAFVIPLTVHRVLNRRRPVIYGDGRQTRCFTYVGDLLRGLLDVFDRPTAVGETFNFGNPTEITIERAVREVLAVCGSDLEPEFQRHESRFGSSFEEILRRVPDVAKARRLLGWEPETDLRAGLESTVRWARDEPSWLRRRAS
jgi:dTDP-alpha-D-glucuronic acid decarboxylase